MQRSRRLLAEAWVRDLASLAAVSLGLLVLAAWFDLLETVYAWSRRLERFEVDELVILLIPLSVGFCLFAARRTREFKRELARHRLTRDDLEVKARELGELAEKIIAERQKVEALGRAKSEFLANLTHKLRTPLNAVLGFSQVICSETLGPIGNDRYLEYARDIRSSGENLLTLMNDIIDLWEIEAGKLELDERLVDVDWLLDQCIALVAEKAQAAEVEIDLALPADLPALYVDQERLKQIFLNLLANAIKYTPAGGRILIEGGLTSGGGLDIGFKDTGVGMAQEDISTVISPWEVVNTASSKYDKIMGLGLPLAKALIELHGGTLSLVSTPHQGTSATVSFPGECVVSRVGSVA